MFELMAVRISRDSLLIYCSWLIITYKSSIIGVDIYNIMNDET